jgi:hypothetical protein
MATSRPSAADVTSMLHGLELPASKEDLITYVHRVRDRAQASSRSSISCRSANTTARPMSKRPWARSFRDANLAGPDQGRL